MQLSFALHSKLIQLVTISSVEFIAHLLTYRGGVNVCFWHEADRLKRHQVYYERETDVEYN